MLGDAVERPAGAEEEFPVADGGSRVEIAFERFEPVDRELFEILAKFQDIDIAVAAGIEQFAVGDDRRRIILPASKPSATEPTTSKGIAAASAIATLLVVIVRPVAALETDLFAGL